MTDTTSLSHRLFDTLADTSDDGGMTDAARDSEAGNFLRHVGSLSMTKTADGLIDPKLVLTWLMQTIGASSFWIGLLVPVREAGALLPQMFTAPRIEAMRRRKWAWVGGSAVQGIAAALIGLVALFLDGQAAGIAIVLLLGLLAVARSVCSVSYKDILGKTVGQTRRGTATGLAGSVSAFGVFLFALILMTGFVERYTLVIGAILLAGGLWIAASALFTTLDEQPSDTSDAQSASVWSQMSLLKEDPQLTRFIAARGLLVGSALAPPFIVILAGQQGGRAFEHLGALVLASSAAAFLSSYVWGRFSDRSSRLVLVVSGLVVAVSLGLAILADLTGAMAAVWVPPVILFLLMLSYHGVRQGRSTHLVDMSPEDKRAQYAAVSNTVIGLVLLGSGVFGALASTAGAIWTVALFAVMSLAGAAVAYTLDEAQTG